MPRTLLVNPRRRRRHGNPSAAQLRARAAFARNYGGRKARRANPKRSRRNPGPLVVSMPAVRRPMPRRIAPVRASNPRRRHRRRRNPFGISLGGGSGRSYVDMLKGGLIGGAGAIAVDLGMGQINRFLPASLQRVPGQLGIGDAVKMILTIAAGKALDKATKGLSIQGARGALAVQFHAALATFLPATMTLGYAVPARVVTGSGRVGPNAVNMLTRGNMARYVRGRAPLLSRYVGGPNPLLSRATTMAREMTVR